AAFMRRSVNDVLVVTGEVAAGGDAFAGRDHVLIGAVGIHDVLLIAGTVIARRLENDALAIRRPVRLAIRATLRELNKILEMTRGLLRDQGQGSEQKPASQRSLHI